MTAALLERLRAFALSLPEAVETDAFGHPNFKAGKKTFCVYEPYEGRASVALKPPRVEGERRLADARFFRTPYLGKHGWVSLWVDRPLSWSFVRELVLESYREVALLRQRRALDEQQVEGDARRRKA